MSFKLYNASATWQIHINNVLKELLDIFYVVYLDDILIFSKNKTQYARHLQLILNCLLYYAAAYILSLLMRSDEY